MRFSSQVSSGILLLRVRSGADPPRGLQQYRRGTTAGARNIISGNLQNGVLLDADTSGNIVQGNYIGTDVTGTVAVPNQQEGVLLGKTSVAGPITNNLIGGTAPGAGNLISEIDRYGHSDHTLKAFHRGVREVG
jgi:hypothetical protein